MGLSPATVLAVRPPPDALRSLGLPNRRFTVPLYALSLGTTVIDEAQSRFTLGEQW